MTARRLIRLAACASIGVFSYGCGGTSSPQPTAEFHKAEQQKHNETMQGSMQQMMQGQGAGNITSEQQAKMEQMSKNMPKMGPSGGGPAPGARPGGQAPGGQAPGGQAPGGASAPAAGTAK